MPKILTAAQVKQYRDYGYVSPVRAEHARLTEAYFLSKQELAERYASLQREG